MNTEPDAPAMPNPETPVPLYNDKNERTGTRVYRATFGLTAREHAAIHLRVPMSGNPWLDAMIIEARRWDAAQAVMPSYYDQDRVACISNSLADANALIHQMKEEQP